LCLVHKTHLNVNICPKRKIKGHVFASYDLLQKYISSTKDYIYIPNWSKGLIVFLIVDEHSINYKNLSTTFYMDNIRKYNEGIP
jgi:hypothetical protein